MLRLLHRFAFSFILVSIFGWAFFLFLFPSFSLAQALKGKGKFGKRKEIALAKGKMETIMTGMRFQVLTFLPSFTYFSIFVLFLARSFSLAPFAVPFGGANKEKDAQENEEWEIICKRRARYLLLRFSSLTSLFLGGWRLLSSEDSEIKDATEKIPAQRKEGGAQGAKGI